MMTVTRSPTDRLQLPAEAKANGKTPYASEDADYCAPARERGETGQTTEAEGGGENN